MVNFNYDVDICVIDEVQMIEDVARGWAWVNAIVGAPASKVIMTGSVNALDAIKKIAAYLEEDLEVVKFKRKNPLEILHKATPLAEISNGTALIAFSRAEVLRIKSKLSKQHKVSVIYGNLSPEVRKEEARRFREGESSVLVATDAIAMGLNLPIKTLLFTTDTKFDGVSNRPLTPNEIIQISGRAGRYGHHDSGYIGATSKKVLKHIESEFHASLHTIKPPFSVKASTTQILSLAKHLKTQNLYKILDYFSRHMNFTGPFVAANIGYMKELAKMIDDKKELSLEDKYMLVQAPVNTRSPLIKRAYFHYINAILNGNIVKYKPSITISKTARSEKELLQAEDEVKKISLYLWIAYKLPELFPDGDIAEAARNRVNHFCQNSLKSKKLIQMQKNKPDKDKNYKDRDKDRSYRRNRRRHR
jgi:ATP-dependent RNA helicase SUPV3L1/SUV3